MKIGEFELNSSPSGQVSVVDFCEENSEISAFRNNSDFFLLAKCRIFIRLLTHRVSYSLTTVCCKAAENP
jgi:hypothetical protein